MKQLGHSITCSPPPLGEGDREAVEGAGQERRCAASPPSRPSAVLPPKGGERIGAFCVLSALALTLLAAPALAQDAAHGKQVYDAHCAMCHAGGAMAPKLAGVVGRKAPAVPGYPYSAALKASHIVWTSANLDAFLAAPTKKVPGTSMFVSLPAPADRKAVIAYLASMKR